MLFHIVTQPVFYEFQPSAGHVGLSNRLDLQYPILFADAVEVSKDLIQNQYNLATVVLHDGVKVANITK